MWELKLKLKNKTSSLRPKWDASENGVEKPRLLASYKVAYRNAKAMKPHTLAEEVIKLCVVDMTDIILGDGAARKLKQVAVSNNTVRRRIIDLSIDIRNQLISYFKASPLKISLQLDESIDMSNYSQLICFVCYIKVRKKRVFVL